MEYRVALGVFFKFVKGFLEEGVCVRKRVGEKHTVLGHWEGKSKREAVVRL